MSPGNVAGEAMHLINKLVDTTTLGRAAEFIILGSLTKLVWWLYVPERGRALTGGTAVTNDARYAEIMPGAKSVLGQNKE